MSADHAVPATIRQYDRLFAVPDPGKSDDLGAVLNENSLTTNASAMIEPGLATAAPEAVFQFEREGYFVADRYEHQSQRPVFNMTIGLRDTWSDPNG